MDDFENELSRMLTESAEDLHPSVEGLVAEGGRVGIRKRRLRRARQVAGAALAVGAVVAATALVGGGHGAPVAAAPAGSPTAARSASAQVTASAKPSPTGKPSPTATASATGTEEITWQVMLKTLHDLLPPGAKLANLDPFMTKANTGPGHHYVELQYDDGGGASTVMLEFSSKQGRQLPRIDCSHWAGGGDEGPRKPGNEKPSCQVIQLPDGGSVDAYITGTDSVGLYDQSVRLYRADGTMLAVTAANATLNQYDGNQDDLITVTRDRPPLGLAGWEALLRSPKWQFKVDQATLDAGVAFAKTVTRFPCSPDVKPAECRID